MSQHQQGGIASAPDTRSSDEMSSTNINEKTSDDAEVGLPQQQQQKPPAGPPGGPPPNGGTTAWLQVLGGFFLFFNTWVCCRCLVVCDLICIGFSADNNLIGYLEHFRRLPDLLRDRCTLPRDFVEHFVDWVDSVCLMHTSQPKPFPN
jgi:hypothetical protein